MRSLIEGRFCIYIYIYIYIWCLLLQVEIDRAAFDTLPREFKALPGLASLTTGGLIVTARGVEGEP